MRLGKNHVKNTIQRNQWLDVLRGLAIFGVVAVHVTQCADQIFIEQNGDSSELISKAVSYGRYGVELFFVLSGWLLASIYGINRSKLEKKYWIRRMARIYPLWMLFLFVQIIRYFIGEGGGWADAQKLGTGESKLIHSPIAIIVMSVTFTLWISASLWNIIPGGWSIQAEVGHYLLFPILRKHGVSRIIRWVNYHNLFMCLLLTLSVSTHVINIPQFAHYAINAWVRLNLFATFQYFLLGVICFYGYSEYKKGKELKSVLESINVSNISIILFTISFFFLPLYSGSQPEALGYIIMMLFTSAGIYRILNLRKIFIFLGKYSYFIYFCHFQILYVFYRLINQYHLTLAYKFSYPVALILLLCITLVVTGFFAILSFRLIEDPILKRSKN